ncbi:MAG: Lrp/AsnC family transcriptional regulator [Candidatus Thorarchaeota archaeon]
MSMKTLLDELDISILRELQKECRTTLQDIADKVDAPGSTVHYRLKRLERAEIIEGYYAKVNPEKLDMEYITMTRLRVALSPGNNDIIGEKLSRIPGLGDFDFLIMTRAKDRDGFMSIIEQVLQIEGVTQTSTSVIGKLYKEDPRLALE